MINKSKILYLDDEQDNLEVFKFNFFDEHDIFLADNISDATRILSNEDIHVLITDYDMPEMTGADFAASIIKDHPDPVRIVLTAHNNYETVIDSINKARVFHFATKPWKKEELANIIENAENYYRLKQKNAQLLEKLTTINHQLEVELNETKYLVSAKSTEIESFERITSHHLKTPLRSIGTMVQWLIKDNMDQMDQTGKNYLTILDQNLKRMYGMMDGLLDYIKVGMNNNSKINGAVGSVFSLLESEFPTLQFQIQSNLNTIAINQDHLDKMMTELCKNAKEAGAKNIKLTFNKSKNHYLINIEDDGADTDSDMNSQIFDLFYTKNRDNSKLGIGLAVVKKIVDLNGGTIQINSDRDTGTEFLIRIPITTV
ncbi:MAG: hybrid sensor histidine kinase/response regulator [bacterium]|nr:hybrid sensor histidine kinase/response regulator [bacterium]